MSIRDLQTESRCSNSFLIELRKPNFVVSLSTTSKKRNLHIVEQSALRQNYRPQGSLSVFRAITTVSMICVSVMGALATFSSLCGQEISAADVIQEQPWNLGNGETVSGRLAITSPKFVTILATTKQYKIRRSDLSENQKKTVALLDNEIADLRVSIANDYDKRLQKPDPNAIRQYQSEKLAATKFIPELRMIEELVRLGLVHQAHIGLGPIIRAGKRQYFATNDKLYWSCKTKVIRGKDGIESGIQLEFYPDGTIHELRYIDHEVTTFNWTFFADGTIKSFTTFQNGLDEGVMIHFHSNGEMLSLAQMAKGYMDGAMHLFDEKENHVAKYRYVGGALVEKSPMINDKEEISRLFLRFVDLKANVFRESWDKDLKKK